MPKAERQSQLQDCSLKVRQGCQAEIANSEANKFGHRTFVKLYSFRKDLFDLFPEGGLRMNEVTAISQSSREIFWLQWT